MPRAGFTGDHPKTIPPADVLKYKCFSFSFSSFCHWRDGMKGKCCAPKKKMGGSLLNHYSFTICAHPDLWKSWSEEEQEEARRLPSTLMLTIYFIQQQLSLWVHTSFFLELFRLCWRYIYIITVVWFFVILTFVNERANRKRHAHKKSASCHVWRWALTGTSLDSRDGKRVGRRNKSAKYDDDDDDVCSLCVSLCVGRRLHHVCLVLDSSRAQLVSL